MSDNVIGVDFGRSGGGDDVCRWVCGCGCVTFEVHSDVGVVCALCGGVGGDEVQSSSGWSLFPSDSVFDGDAEFSDIRLGSDIPESDRVSFARRRALGRLGDDGCCLMVGAFEGGDLCVWSDATSRTQYRWVLRRLVEAARLIGRGIVR